MVPSAAAVGSCKSKGPFTFTKDCSSSSRSFFVPSSTRSMAFQPFLPHPHASSRYRRLFPCSSVAYSEHVASHLCHTITQKSRASSLCRNFLYAQIRCLYDSLAVVPGTTTEPPLHHNHETQKTLHHKHTNVRDLLQWSVRHSEDCRQRSASRYTSMSSPSTALFT